MLLALFGVVDGGLVADRFLQTGERRWLDIATGVSLVSDRPPDDIGLAAWRVWPPAGATPDDENVALAVRTGAARIAAAANRPSAVVMCAIDVVIPPAWRVLVCDEAARRVQPLGFVAVRSTVRLPPGVRHGLLHRHVVLLAVDGEAALELGAAVSWIRALTSTSARPHVLVRLCGDEGGPVGADHVTRRSLRARESVLAADDAGVSGETASPGSTDDWDEHVRRTGQRVAAWVRAGKLVPAAARIAGVVVEARVRRVAVPPAIRLLDAQVAFGRGQFERARTVLTGCPGRSASTGAWKALAARACGELPAIDIDREWSDRSGALVDRKDARRVTRFIEASGTAGISRWGLWGKAGVVLQSVSTLLQMVHEADDEYAALKQGCAWVREHAGADAVGIVNGEGTKVVASDGIVQGDLDDADLRVSFEAGRPRTVADGPHALVTTPVRYGGRTIGFALVRGDRDAVETLVDAASSLASACAPALRGRLDALLVAGASDALTPEILGRSPAIGALRRAIGRSAGTTFPVLIEGESGTGKELVARAVHRLSARRDRSFFALNCAALADELVEAELFGHARGAFTGAVQTRAGLFESAHGGTLFLDEVAELSPRAQAKLLRVLQEREVRRVGEPASRPIDVRVIAATNQPLVEAVARGAFREDLLFRLAVVRIRVPPLRERIEDIPVLTHAFWRALAAEAGKRAVIGADALGALCRHGWPGNVRELQNAVASLIVAAPTRGQVGARHVDHALGWRPVGPDADASVSLEAARRALERRMVTAALARHGGRRVKAARELGLSRQGLTKAIKRLGLAV